MNATRLSILGISLSILLGLSLARPQDETSKKKSSSQSETIARPMTEKERKAKQKKQRDELATPYKKWLNEDVAYIISDEERAAFKKLNNDEERETFIENFWLRRDPSPDTEENEFKEEHYRRIAYANEHFASGIPGWKTDRGRIYITFGPPDEIEDHSSGGFYERPPEEGGGETSTFPFQQWRYRYIEGIGNNIIIEFVDPTMSGEFRMTSDPSEKDALLYVPGAGLTLMEQLGMSDKTARFNNTDGTHLGVPFGGQPESMNEFNRIEQFAKLQKAPPIKFHDLESEVLSKISYNQLPMKVRIDYFPVTDASVMTTITVQFDNKDLQFKMKDGVQKAELEILGTITNQTHRRVATPFDDPVTIPIPPSMLAAAAQNKSIYQKAIPLQPGSYRLNVTAKDVVAGNVALESKLLSVPRIDQDHLSASTLVLADYMQHVDTKSIGLGMFVLGDTKVRPRIANCDTCAPSFKPDERIGIYVKLYNFEPDENTHKAVGQVEYELVKTGTTDKLVSAVEDVNQNPEASASQVTIEKYLDLKTMKLAPGSYTLRIKVTDKKRNQSLPLTAQFTVT
ncbi:MAG: GWxTD domain-containing protein [Bryobacteraceae bacterium]